MFTFKKKHINNKKKFLENISVIFQFAIVRLRLYLHFYCIIQKYFNKEQKTKNFRIEI